MTSITSATKKNRLDYKAPDFFIREVELEFDLRDGETFVTSKMKIERNGIHTNPLVLNGNKLETLSVAVDGNLLAPLNGYQTTDETLTLPIADDAFILETKVRIKPEENTALAGLYKSNGMWCTQCEATDFRNITWFIDRPDNMASYKVKVIADKSAPVLLSNGNLVDKGDLPNNRHYTVWHDPAPKPCYLFALVAADLDFIEDKFHTMSGRDVTLRIYCEAKDTDKLNFAMESLKNSMRWDEVNYGREYELDLFNVVAVDYFNMGAMENRSLNIFNTMYVLAHQKTQSDAQFAGVEGVIAHEFFHHWTGNNVTLRDWPELTLKEGLTVFRDQSFSSDMGSAAINRIENVQGLRGAQFKQDSGPLAHAIRADEYDSINNFYTATVYDKGAEVIGMIKTLIGDQNYRKATDLYFDRHTGQAVTCDDFVQCMEDASGYDMSQFKLWYTQAGTPKVHAHWAHDPATQEFTLILQQTAPENRPSNLPVVIPVSVGIVGPNGQDVILDQQGNITKVLELNQPQQVFTFANVPAGSIPSLLRNFSAPVNLEAAYTDADLRHLMVNDSDGFNQWEAGQRLVMKEIQMQVDNVEAGIPAVVNPIIIDAMRDMINRTGMDKQLLALMLQIPSFGEIGLKRKTVNPEAIMAVEKAFNTAIRTSLETELLALYHANDSKTPYSYDVQSVARRSLKNTALYYLSADETANNPAMTALAAGQYKASDNMTDRSKAIRALLRMDPTSVASKDAMDDYYQTFKNDSTPLDSWFGMNVTFARDAAAQAAINIVQHPDFQNASPNRIRAVVGGFVGASESFHKRDGSGYAYIAGQIINLDAKNAQTAARFVDFLADFKKLQEPWHSKMKGALLMVASQPTLSEDVDDKLKKILGADYPVKKVLSPPTPPAIP